MEEKIEELQTKLQEREAKYDQLSLSFNKLIKEYLDCLEKIQGLAGYTHQGTGRESHIHKCLSEIILKFNGHEVKDGLYRD